VSRERRLELEEGSDGDRYEGAHRDGLEMGVGERNGARMEKGMGGGVEKEERRSWAGGESGVGGGGEDRHRDGDGGMEVVGEE